MKAMVLAAGKATRLRPLTDDVAKPALAFCGRAILDRVLDGLAEAGVDEAIVNLHHAPGTVRDLVAARGASLPRVSFSDETRELLGTGGALVPVRHAFEGEAEFVVVNGDCVHEIDVRAVVEDHRRSGAACTLVTRDRGEPGFGALLVDAEGRVTSFSSPVRGLPGERHFLSVQVVSPAVLEYLPEGGSFGSFTDWYPRALAAGLVFRVHETDAEWHALDSRELYLEATRDYLARRGGRPHVATSARVSKEARVDGASAVHDEAVVEPGAVLGGSVLLAGARVGAGAHVVGSILGAGAFVAAGEVVNDRLIAARASA